MAGPGVMLSFSPPNHSAAHANAAFADKSQRGRPAIWATIAAKTLSDRVTPKKVLRLSWAEASTAMMIDWPAPADAVEAALPSRTGSSNATSKVTRTALIPMAITVLRRSNERPSAAAMSRITRTKTAHTDRSNRRAARWAAASPSDCRRTTWPKSSGTWISSAAERLLRVSCGAMSRLRRDGEALIGWRVCSAEPARATRSIVTSPPEKDTEGLRGSSRTVLTKRLWMRRVADAHNSGNAGLLITFDSCSRTRSCAAPVNGAARRSSRPGSTSLRRACRFNVSTTCWLIALLKFATTAGSVARGATMVSKRFVFNATCCTQSTIVKATMQAPARAASNQTMPRRNRCGFGASTGPVGSVGARNCSSTCCAACEAAGPFSTDNSSPLPIMMESL